MEDLAPTFTEGWANGTLRLSAEDIEDLYKADLYINVASRDNDRELRGRIVPQMMTEAHEMVRPILLTGPETKVSGIAWTNVDNSCKVNYQVRLAGVAPKTESRLTLKDFPYHNVRNLAMMPGRVTELEEFRGSESIGSQGNIHKLTMARLDAGDAAFVVENANGEADVAEKRFRVEGRIEHVTNWIF